MKTKIIVRKIPTEDILDVLVEMRESGVEFVNFECVLTPEKDIIHVSEYSTNPDPNQKTIDYEPMNKKHMRFIKKFINDHGSN